MRRVLVVDDNVPLAENLAEIVTDSDVGEAVVASSGQGALQLLEAGRFDVMVTDMRMPGMSGTELIHRAHQVDPELPVVLMTAFVTDQELERAEQQGLLMVFGKPVPAGPLLARVSRARRTRPVLIVENDPALAQAAAGVLRENGFSTVTALSAGQLDRVTVTPSLVVVDARMPGEAECASLERVRALFPGVPAVLMTTDRAQLRSRPQVTMLDKPFDPSELLKLAEANTPQRQL